MSGTPCPPCQWFGLRWPSPRVYSLYVRANGDLQEDSCQRVLPRTAVGSAPSLRQAATDSCLTGDTPTPAGISGSVYYEVMLPYLSVLIHTRFCLCPPRVEPLFPLVLWRSCNWILLAFKVRSPGNFYSLCQILRLKTLIWGSESS